MRPNECYERHLLEKCAKNQCPEIIKNHGFGIHLKTKTQKNLRFKSHQTVNHRLVELLGGSWLSQTLSAALHYSHLSQAPT